MEQLRIKNISVKKKEQYLDTSLPFDLKAKLLLHYKDKNGSHIEHFDSSYNAIRINHALDNFNKTLRPGESARKVVAIYEIMTAVKLTKLC